MRKILNFLQNLFINLILNFWGAVIFAALLALHFIFDISIKWALIALGAWVLYVVVRLIIISFFMGLPTPEKKDEYRENKNPYSK